MQPKKILPQHTPEARAKAARTRARTMRLKKKAGQGPKPRPMKQIGHIGAARDGDSYQLALRLLNAALILLEETR